jgi:hypothetical protein
MTYQQLKDSVNKLNSEQLQQDVAIGILDEQGIEIFQEVGFSNPVIPEGPCFDDVEDSILDANHAYLVVMT